MNYKVYMPEISDGKDEITFVSWLVNCGDTVDEGQGIAEVVTDKASFDVPAPVKGEIIKTHFNKDDVVKTGELLAEILVSGR